MKDLNEIMKAAQAAQAKMLEATQRVEAMVAEGQAGGGMVRLMLSGKGALVSVKIDPSLLKADEGEILEDLLAAAHANALARLDQKRSAEMAQTAQNLGLPPGLKLPF
jgi:hypothetical protein